MTPWLRERARISPEADALIALSDGGRRIVRWSFSALLARAEAITAQLATAGVGPGVRVAILCSGRASTTLAVHAVFLAGGCAVPLSPRFPDSELRARLARVRASSILTDAAERERASDLADSAKPLLVVEGGSAGTSSATVDARALRGLRHDPEAPALLLFTSGSSGPAKPALLSYRALAASAVASALQIGATSQERWIACMPLHHVGGLNILARCLLYGGAPVALDGFDPAAVVDACEKHRGTRLSVVPVMLRDLVAALGDRRAPGSLRTVLVGGAPASSSLVDAALDQGWPVSPTYGMTEMASQIATMPPGRTRAHPGSVGPTLLGTEAKILDGEIIVRGATMFSGYADDAAATADRVRDGWLHTGDLGRIDEEGLLYVHGRIGSVIVSGGENVHPAEVESALGTHPAVAAAVVVGAPDARWGERPVAFVVVEDGERLDLSALRRHLRGRLAAFQLPDRFVEVDVLPTLASGKVDRAALARRALHSSHSVGDQ